MMFVGIGVISAIVNGNEERAERLNQERIDRNNQEKREAEERLNQERLQAEASTQVRT